ncbi:hypothetical protein BDW74DRAFT_158805 [Aspergillus multicolor]|uniref:uncharacterized protein n=1 Tax=Aspergillus multicolor TaxID=41759 RepID=UPI003CCCE596
MLKLELKLSTWGWDWGEWNGGLRMRGLNIGHLQLQSQCRRQLSPHDTVTLLTLLQIQPVRSANGHRNDHERYSVSFESNCSHLTCHSPSKAHLKNLSSVRSSGKVDA